MNTTKIPGQEECMEIMPFPRNEVAKIRTEMRVSIEIQTKVPLSSKFKIKAGDVIMG